MNNNYQTLITFEAICKAMNENAEALLSKWAEMGLTEDEIGYKMLKLWYAAVNGDWKADISDSNQAKYYPLMYKHREKGFVLDRVGYYYDYTNVSPRLCCETRAQVVHITTYAHDAYQKYFS